MRVIIIFDDFSDVKVSGEYIAAKNNVCELEKSGVSVKVISTQKLIGSNKNNLFVLLNLFFSLRAFFCLKNEIAVFNADIVHIHNITPYLSPSVFIAAKLKSCKVFHTLHHSRWACIEGSFYNNDTPCTDCLTNTYSGIRKSCVKGSKLASILMTMNNLIWIKTGFMHKWVDKYISVSSFTKTIHTNLGFPDNKLSVLGHWKNYNEGNSHSTFEERDIDIIFTGRVSVAKGIDILIDLAENSSYSIYICGDGPDMKKLHRIKDLDNVRILGKLSHTDILKYLSRSKLLIMPSICSESFGLAAAEAVVHGTPILVSDKGALPDIISESKAGHVVSGNSYNDYLHKIKKLLDSPENWDILHQNALHFSKDLESKSFGQSTLLSLYKSVL